MTKNIVLVHSKPGLGKTTLARSVAQALNDAGITADHFSMGDMLRGMLDGSIDSPLTAELEKYHYELSHHLPVPDGELTADIAAEFIKRSGAQISVIDGYPRYELLLPGFRRIIAQNALNIVLVVVLQGSDELATERIVGRNRQALGEAENATARLKNYAEVSVPVVAKLAAEYPVLYVDAAKELEDKTAHVVQVVTARLAT